MSQRLRPTPTAADDVSGGAALRRLDGLVRRSRLALFWERLWPLAWAPLGVVMAFLTASWLGLWLDLTPPWRMAGLALFGLALAAALLPLLGLRPPNRTAALDRLDRDSGVAHGPARTLEDTLAVGAGDTGSQALWALHRRRAEAAVSRLHVTPPSPGMPVRDRYALRAAAIVTVAASAIIAGPEIGSRLGSAFDWRGPAAAVPSFRIDGWIDPPHYTRLPPLMIDLAAGEQVLRAPARSTVVVRIAGTGDADLTPRGGLTALPPPENRSETLREQRFNLTGDAELDIRTGLASGLRLVIQAIPDLPPTIAFTGAPELQARGPFILNFRAKDDYGITAAEGLIDQAETGRRTLIPAPRITLNPPPHGQDGDQQANVDLTEHGWAGARVTMTLVARDEAGQEGRSETISLTLPQRPFTKPLARALVEERRNLILDPDRRKRVQTALDALLIAPEMFTKEWGVFLGLRSVATRLRAARGDPALLAVADDLWQMALLIEDGDLSDAERALRAAQERLQEAMDRNAPDQELQRLMDELRQAMDRFLQEFAERMQRDQQNADPNQPQQQADRVISQDDLNRMMQEMQDAMKRGDMAEAQRLLNQLRDIMQNLQTARPNSRMSDPMAREMNRQMNELDEMAREQQRLRDETFREGQNERMQRGDRRQNQQGQQGQQGQRGQRQQGQRGQQGQQGEQGEDGQGLAERQQALRDRLQELQRRMQGMGMRGEQGLADAEQSMRDAEGALGQGQNGEAVDAQGRALEGLQRGMQGMAQQMQEMMGQGDGTEQAGDQPGEGQPGQRGRASQRDNDPLGRPTRSRDFSDGRVRVPTADESAVQRARRILEELRRKLGDPTRPREELDYFERLLRQN